MNSKILNKSVSKAIQSRLVGRGSQYIQALNSSYLKNRFFFLISLIFSAPLQGSIYYFSKLLNTDLLYCWSEYKIVPEVHLDNRTLFNRLNFAGFRAVFDDGDRSVTEVTGVTGALFSTIAINVGGGMRVKVRRNEPKYAL